MGDLNEDPLSVRSCSTMLGSYVRYKRRPGVRTVIFSRAWWLLEICANTWSSYVHVQPCLVAMGDLYEDLLSLRSCSAMLGCYGRAIRRPAVLPVLFSRAWWLWESYMKTRCPYGHVQPCLVAMGELHEDSLSVRSCSAMLGGYGRAA